MMMSPLELRKKGEKLFDALFDARRPYEAAWRRYRMAYAPFRGKFTRAEGKVTRTRWRRNSRPSMAVMEFAAGMKGGLTNPSTPWFNLGVFNRDTMADEESRAWLSESRDLMLGAMLRTNVYDQLTDFFEEIGCFGTAAIYIADDDEDIFRARVLTIGEYAIGEDDRKRVNQIGIRKIYTLEQLVEEFGYGELPETVRRDWDLRSPRNDDEYTVNILVHPNPEYDPKGFGKAGMAWQTLWWLADFSDAKKPLLKTGGYREFPFMVSRWKVMGDDIYGRGHPGEIAIDDVETLQKLESASREAILKMVDPPLLADDRINDGTLDVRPGGTSWYTNLNNMPAPQVVPLFAMAFDSGGCEVKIESLKMDINRAFYVDLFRMWSSDMRRDRTATEVQTREQEKMYVLSPIIERQMSELLDPLIKRIFAMMSRAGYFAPPPPAIASMEFNVEYSSVLANLQKQSAMAGIDAVVNRIAMLAQIQASSGASVDVLDVIDMDEAIQQTADGYSVPVGIIYGDDKIAQIRQAREQEMAAMAQQQQMMAMAQNATNVASAAKSMSETPMGDSNALDASLAALGLGGGTNGVDSEYAPELEDAPV